MLFFLKKEEEEMERLKGSSWLFLCILSLVMTFFLLQPARGEEVKEMPGPDLHDGFGLVATDENPGFPNLIFKEYSREKEYVLVTMIKSNLEIVLISWGVTKRKEGFNEDNMRTAIKLENGYWFIGIKSFMIESEINNKEELLISLAVQGEDKKLHYGKSIKQ